MFIIANFIGALAYVLSAALEIFWWILLVRVLISWVSPSPYNPIVQFLYRATEPVLEPIRRVMPPMTGVDLSPLVAFLIIIFSRKFVIASLFGIAQQLRY